MAKNKGLGKILLGMGIGAGLGVLLAPKSGDETRKELKKEINKFIDSIKDIDMNEVKDEFLNKIEDISDELVELAKEKGTPVIEASADAVRQKAISATKSVLAKLEEK